MHMCEKFSLRKLEFLQFPPFVTMGPQPLFRSHHELRSPPHMKLLSHRADAVAPAGTRARSIFKSVPAAVGLRRLGTAVQLPFQHWTLTN